MTLWDQQEREAPAPPQQTTSRAETPPRIPIADQRLIRLLALAALLTIAASVAAALNIDPIGDPVAGLGVSLLFGLTLSFTLAPILLIESYRRHPGQWRGRRARALRRSLIVGVLVGGYSAFRVAGLGSPTGLLIGAALAVVIEAAFTRADNDAV
ncbi:MAG: hypothetical protein ACK51I_00275 [Chloroflexota bacterium]